MGGLGFVKRRRTTDKCMLFVFLFCCIFMIVVFIWAGLKSDLTRLLHKVDDHGNVCGRNITNKGVNFGNKSFLLSMDYSNTKDALHICVELCPNITLQTRKNLAQFAQENRVQLCDYHVPVSEYENETMYPSNTKGPCPVLPLLASKPLLKQCVPVFARLKKIEGEEDDFMVPPKSGMDSLSNAADSIRKSMGTVLGMSFAAFALYFMFMWLLPCLNKCFVKVMMNLLNLMLLVLATVLWIKYFETPTSQELLVNGNVTNITKLSEFLSSNVAQEKVFFIAVFITILLIINVLITIYLWSRLKFINACFKQGKSMLCKMPLLLIMPIIFNTLLILLILLFIWVFLATTSIALHHMKTPRLADVGRESVPFFGLNIPMVVMFVLYLLMLAWTTQVLLGLQHFSIAVPVAVRFFNDKQANNRIKIHLGILYGLRYHLGSIAFGGSVNVILKLARLMVEKLEPKIRRIAFLACMVDCLDWLINAKNTSTLSVIAIQGTSYCASLLKTSKLIITNLVKFAVVSRAVTVYGAIGQIMISLLCAFLTKKIVEVYSNIQNAEAPAALVFIISFVIGIGFFSVFESVVTTLAISFCILKDSGAADPYNYVSPEEAEMYEQMSDIKGDEKDSQMSSRRPSTAQSSIGKK